MSADSGKSHGGPSSGVPGERLFYGTSWCLSREHRLGSMLATIPATPHGADGSRRSPSAYGAFALNRTGVWACGKGIFLPNIPRSLPGTLAVSTIQGVTWSDLGPLPKSYRHFRQWRQERWSCVLAIIQRATTDSSATDLTLLLPYTVAALRVSAACQLNPLGTTAHAFAQSTPNRYRMCKYL